MWAGGIVAANWLLGVSAALVFYKSGMQKVRHPYSFREILKHYELVPASWLDWLAPAVAVGEVLVAIWLLLPWTRFYGAVLGVAFQALFMTIMLKRMGMHLPLGCGCFQLNVPQQVTWRHIGFNSLMTAAMIGILACT